MAALISRKPSGLDDQTSRKPSGLNSQNSQKLYETYYMRVFSYAMTLAGDRNLAEEITQETFFRAFSRKNEFRGDSSEVTWLCAIAKNYFVDEKRRQKKAEKSSSRMESGSQVRSGSIPMWNSICRTTP